MILPFTPGGGTDIAARLVAQQLTEKYGQQIVVDNRPGAGGVIGADLVAKARPDGYTLLFTLNALAANHTLYPNRPYDTLKDFTPIVLVAMTSSVLVVHPSLPVKTVRELVAMAKARPNEFAYGSSGMGAPAHLSVELFKLLSGVQLVHVPYKGASPALIDLIAGETQLMIVALPGALPHIKSGKLRALGVTGIERVTALPGVPTLIEAGIKDYRYDTWYGLFAPSGVAREIVASLNSAVMQILTLPDFKARLTARGLEPAGSTPEAFREYFQADVEKLARVIRASGAKVQQ